MRISKSDVNSNLKCLRHARFRAINGKAIWETCGTKFISVYIKENCVTKSLLKSIPEEEYTGLPTEGGGREQLAPGSNQLKE